MYFVEYKLLTECVNFLAKLVQTFPKQMGDQVSTVYSNIFANYWYFFLLVKCTEASGILWYQTDTPPTPTIVFVN